jgi:hypothetical protein
MKKLSMLLIVLLLVPSVMAELVEFKYEFEVDFKGEREFDIIDANDNTLFKHYAWSNATTPSDDEFTVKIYRDINNSCKSLTEQEVLDFYGSVGSLVNTSLSCYDLKEAYGRVMENRDQCKTDLESKSNQTNTLTTDRDDWKTKYDNLNNNGYETQYRTCNTALEKEEKSNKSKPFIWFIIGGIVVYLWMNRGKKEMTPVEIQEAGFHDPQ